MCAEKEELRGGGLEEKYGGDVKFAFRCIPRERRERILISRFVCSPSVSTGASRTSL